MNWDAGARTNQVRILNEATIVSVYYERVNVIENPIERDQIIRRDMHRVTESLIDSCNTTEDWLRIMKMVNSFQKSADGFVSEHVHKPQISLWSFAFDCAMMGATYAHTYDTAESIVNQDRSSYASIWYFAIKNGWQAGKQKYDRERKEE